MSKTTSIQSLLDPSRRKWLGVGTLTAAGIGIPMAAYAENSSTLKSPALRKSRPKEQIMSDTVITRDGTRIFYKDWGPKSAQPIMFHHGWPLSSDDWDPQMQFFLQRGYRVVAHDRRGHGRSAQVSEGHDMDHYASDAFAVVEHLDLRNVVHIGH
jgi:non-heme chloroperoxidase